MSKQTETMQKIANQIADMMEISCRTIEYYAANIKKKFSCETKRQLVYVLEESGLIEQLESFIDVSHFTRTKEAA